MKQIGILLLGGILLASCGRQAATAPEVFHVRTTTATPNLTPDNRREYPFISRPYNETTLSFRVSGPLENNRLQAGQHFRAGQTLLAMDERDFRLEEERTRALEEQTRAEYNRVEALYREGNISGTAREKARADHRVAKAAHDAALNALQDTRRVDDLLDSLQSLVEGKQRYRTRFLVRGHEEMTTLPVGEVAYFYTESRVTFAVTHAGREHILDLSLDRLAEQLDPRQFFRANRQFILNVESVTRLEPYFGGKIIVHTRPATRERVVVSKEKAPSLKLWLNF